MMNTAGATRRIQRWAIYGPVVVLALAGCKGSTTSSTASTTVGATVTTSAAPAGATATTAAAGGNLTPGVAGDPDSYVYSQFKRVSFAQGTDNATVADTIEAGKVNGYIVNARAGQNIFVNVDAPGRFAAFFEIYDPNDKLIAEAGSSDPDHFDVFATPGGTFNTDFVLPLDGDYLIIINGDSGIVAELFVEITGSTPLTTAVPAICSSYTTNETPPIVLCDKGDIVIEIQQALNIGGFSTAEDGFYGPATEAAVREYQKAVSLDPTGVVTHELYVLMVAV